MKRCPLTPTLRGIMLVPGCGSSLHVSNLRGKRKTVTSSLAKNLPVSTRSMSEQTVPALAPLEEARAMVE